MLLAVGGDRGYSRGQECGLRQGGHPHWQQLSLQGRHPGEPSKEIFGFFFLFFFLVSNHILQMNSQLSFRTVHLLYPYLIFHFSFEPPSFCIFSRQITSAGIPPQGDIFRCRPLLHLQKKINWTSSICWVFVRFVSWSSSGPFGTHESLIFSFLCISSVLFRLPPVLSTWASNLVLSLCISSFLFRLPPLHYPYDPLIWSFLFVFPLSFPLRFPSVWSPFPYYLSRSPKMVCLPILGGGGGG
jgi:hypothetical protein